MSGKKGKIPPPRERKKPRKAPTAGHGKPTVRTLSHPLFGEIPLVEVTRTAPSGETWTCVDYDPDYRPPVPPGGIAGDIRKQSYCIMCHAPRYFYLDETRNCVQCGKEFTFGAAEQKFWYETLKFHFDSTAIRCPGCRRLRRTDRFIRLQLQLATKECEENDKDPLAFIRLAEATLNYFRRFGQGDLHQAISACRKARKLSPTLPGTQELETLLKEAAFRNQTGKSPEE